MARLSLLPSLTLAVALIACATASASAEHKKLQPAKRAYDSHIYYVLELDPNQLPTGHAPHDVAAALGAEHVEQVGHLEDHYLIRAPMDLVSKGEDSWTPQLGALQKRETGLLREGAAAGLVERDLVMERYDLLRRRKAGPASHLRARSVTLSNGRLSSKSAVRSLERQYPRQRVKRDLPVLPPSLPRRSSVWLEARQGVTQAAVGIIEQMANKFSIADPLWPKQWHLVNGAIQQNDINVTGVWDDGYTGSGVNVAIVDDGLDMHSDDLSPNFHAEGSWDYNDNTALPEPRLSDDQHGTRCAGEIAAAKNDVCGVGVAYKAGIAGIRILSASISDADEASSLNYGYQSNDIYSCSWGPPDDGRSMEAPGRLIVKAMLNGVQKGRGGKGSVFVFASGNGGAVDDQCNFDGYTNSLMSITVGAIDRKGLHPFYSEACSANMVVTYSSGSGDNIHTTDVGKQECTDRHGGTSAAAPIAAGIFALVLEARPDLTWRDMQHLCVRTAIQVNPEDPDWQMTASGRNYNHKYGFGKLDAWAIVNAAKTWELVKPQTWWASPTAQSGLAMTESGTTSTIQVSAAELQAANFEKLEHVTITVHVVHSRRGNIEVELDSPRGMKSILARPRRFDEDANGMPGWVFMSVKHWDENPIGSWTLRVRDRQNNGHNGTLVSWSMQLWGSAIDGSKAEPYRLPGDPDDEDAVFDEDATITSDLPASTPASLLPTKTHIKPTANLPDDHAEATGEATVSFGESYSTIDGPDYETSAPTPTQEPTYPTAITGEDDIESGAEEEYEDEENGYNGGSLYGGTPGYLSGVSSLVGSTTWLFVAGGLIIVFVAGVTAFFWLRKRPGQLGRGGGYDFAPMTDEEDMPMSAMERGGLMGGRGGGGGEGSNPRTRELFNAFALHSDEEDESDDERPRKDGRLAYTDEGMESFLDEDPRAPLAPEEQHSATSPRRSSEQDRERTARERFSDDE